MTIGWHFDNTYSKLSNTFQKISNQFKTEVKPKENQAEVN
jgi:hypothetical protein